MDPNSDQADDVPSGLPWITGDRVGNECPVQVARVHIDGRTTVELNLQFDNVVLEERSIGFAGVDLGTFTDLQCNWALSPNGVCDLDLSSITTTFSNP